MPFKVLTTFCCYCLTALMAMHAIWVREHNRIANYLHVLNPYWNDEKLFQEARKIVAAMMQHITYNEWLEVLFNETLVRPLSFIFILELSCRNQSTLTNFGLLSARFGAIKPISLPALLLKMASINILFIVLDKRIKSNHTLLVKRLPFYT